MKSPRYTIYRHNPRRRFMSVLVLTSLLAVAAYGVYEQGRRDAAFFKARNN